ncbi:MAG TPA: transglutaminase-like domain-containing protein [Chloroflexota bacterium]|nr:transglutaminase-like domain-containing protein [Chloroflexota bacterium]
MSSDRLPPRGPRASFAELMRQPEERFTVGEAALAVAAAEYPDLDVEHYLAVLEEMGGEAKSRLRRARSADETVRLFSHFVMEELDFHGNREEFEDPRNSFLNDVIDRRTGIPITLAVICMEVGRRAGIDVRGVNFPGRFLAKYSHPAGFELVIDPYDGGRILSEADCQTLLDEMSNGTLAYSPLLLRSATTKQIVVRMLNNLKRIYVQSHYFHKALRVADMILAAAPSDAGELRERGLLQAELANYVQAQADLNAALERTPDPAAAAAIRQTLDRIDAIQAALK